VTSAASAWPRNVSYAVAALALLVAARFSLDHALLAGLFAAMILDEGHRRLRGAGLRPFVARWAAVALFVVLGALLTAIFASFVRVGLSRLPVLLDRVLPRVDELAARFGVNWPVASASDLRPFVLETMKANARSITTASGLMTRGVFQVVIGVAVAVLRFLSLPADGRPPLPGKGLDEEVMHECGRRLDLFSASFERVMGAQIIIAAINAVVTAVFLFALGLPFRTFLTLTTFVCGLVPILGNVVSNTLIVGAALTVSNEMAAAALVFLVLIHKAEYFLNSKIIGGRIDTPMWATLAGLLIGEAVMGVSGVILAPTLIYYLREELRTAPRR
jgi:predicted PurR-regulated permease PerM